MEPNNNLQKMIAKKLWHMLRVAIFMLKKGISKTKLFSDLNLLLKRGKIAGKAIQNLLFHHHHIPTTSDLLTTTTQHHLHEYEFSCSNTPSHPFTNLFKRKNRHLMLSLEEDDEVMNANVVMKALERLQSETASPALPGFGKSPVMRKMKKKDSPFHQMNNGGDEDSHVDEAADEFIKRFYKNLRKQNSFAAS
ncbi:hypothetical protein Leryth_010227 [Lithospermum erythrorhizon]|nr:hypothetical protein Leryth_010227 [Lithospermum erythrorhizon]